MGDTVKAINHVPVEKIVNKDNYCDFVTNERQLFSDQDTNIVTIKNKQDEIRELKMYQVKLFE